MDFTLLLQQKPILQYIFPNFDGGKEVCKNWLYLCNLTLGCMKIDVGAFDTSSAETSLQNMEKCTVKQTFAAVIV